MEDDDSWAYLNPVTPPPERNAQDFYEANETLFTMRAAAEDNIDFVEKVAIRTKSSIRAQIEFSERETRPMSPLLAYPRPPSPTMMTKGAEEEVLALFNGADDESEDPSDDSSDEGGGGNNKKIQQIQQ